jgi:outer membrane protein assembly factor BamE (lipoprotein component of BamABCDE complex)
VALCVAALVAGCATRGRAFNVDQVPFIKRGVTTQEDVRRWFGEPSTIKARGSGVSAWGYLYEETDTTDTRMLARIGEWIAMLMGQRVVTPPLGARYETTTTHTLQVFFDPDGVVTEYEYTRRQMPTRVID